MRLDTLKWNDHTFKQLSKEAKLIYCFLEAHANQFYFLGYNAPYEVFNRKNETIVELQ